VTEPAIPATSLAGEAPTAPTRDEALAVSGFTVFRGSLPAVRDVSLSVRTGDALGILGRNGAGKTTLLAGLMGTLPTEGAIFFHDSDIARAPAWKRARDGLALVPQGRQLLPGLTVQENLRIAELERSGEGPQFDIHELFPAIRPLYKRKAGFLSGGEQQQVAIARALLRRPTLLLLDEPTEGLAPAIVSEIHRVLGRLVEEGLTLILAEQHHHIVAAMCSHFLVLRGGEVAAYESDPATIERYYGL
jgi:ABC-type branched-subunit amino acid transport system ATPase component